MLSALRKKIHGGKFVPVSACNSFEYHGEDAMAFSDYYHIVADGVSGSQGRISSSILSKGLVNSVESILTKFTRNGTVQLSSDFFQRAILVAIHEALQACHDYKNSSIASTLSVAYFDLKEGIIHTFTVGDSKVLVIRNGRVIYETPSILLEFNRPSTVTTSRRLDTEGYAVGSFHLMKKDICLTVSDGIIDNLFQDDLLDLVQDVSLTETKHTTLQVKKLAFLLVQKASKNSKNLEETSYPYAVVAANALIKRIELLLVEDPANEELQNTLEEAENILANLPQKKIFDYHVYQTSKTADVSSFYYSLSQLRCLAMMKCRKNDDITAVVTCFT